jgi:hypothetical protein
MMRAIRFAHLTRWKWTTGSLSTERQLGSSATAVGVISGGASAPETNPAVVVMAIGPPPSCGLA